MAALGSLVVKLALEYAQFTGGLDKSEQAALQASKRIQDTFDGLKGRVVTTAAAIAGGLAAGFTLSAFKSLITSVAESNAALGDLALTTGSTTEALSGLAAVGKFTDTSAQAIGAAMNKLTNNLASATEESKGTALAVQALGIDFETFRKMSPEQQMQAVAKAMGGFAEGSGKAAIAMALYGKEGAKMLPFLKDLGDVGELHAKVTTEQSDAADNFGRNLTRLQASGEAWKKELANGMIPALDLGTQAMVDVMNGTGGIRDEIRKLSADGSIGRWTRSAVTGLTYVVDAVQYVIRGVKIAGESLGAYAAAGVAYFGGIGSAIKQVLAGDFTGAVASMKSGMDSSKTIISGLGESIIGTFGEDTLGSKIRARMGEIEATGNAGEAAKPKLNFSNVLDDNKKSADGASDSLAALIEQLRGLDRLQTAQAKETTADLQSLRKRGALSDIDAIERVAAAEIESLATSKSLLQQELAIYETKKNGKKDMAATQAKIAEQDAKIAGREKQLGRDLAETYATLSAAADKRVDARIRDTGALEKQLRELQFENTTIGKTAAQVRALDMARSEEMATALEREAVTRRALDGNNAEAEQLERQAELLRQIAGQKGANEARQSWFGFWESVDSTAHDTFVNVGNEGMSAFKRIGTTLKSAVLDVLYQMTIKKWFFNIAASVTGTGASIASAAGMDGGGGAGGAMNIASGLSSASGLYGAGSAFASGFTGYAAGSALGGGATIAGSATGLGSLAGGTGGFFSGAGAALAGMGPVGWAALAVLAVAAVASQMKGDSRFGSSYRYDEANDSRINGVPYVNGGQVYSTNGTLGSPDENGVRIIGGPNGGTDFNGMSATQAKFVDGINETYKKLGSKAQLTAFQSGFESSEKGKGFSYAGGVTNTGVVFGQGATGNGHLNNRGSMNAEEAQASYINELKQSTLQALQAATDIPKSIADRLKDVDIDALSGQALDGLIATIGQVMAEVDSLQGAMKLLPFDNLKDLSFDAASGLIAAAGGLEALSGNLGFYLENVYGEGERAAVATATLAAEFSKLGIAVPDNAAQLRDLIAAQDISTAAGQNMAAALLGLAPAFANVAAAARASAQQMMGVMASYASAGEQRQYQLEQIQKGLADGGVNVSTGQLGNTSRDQAWQFYKDAVAANDTRTADAIFSQLDAFAKVTDAAQSVVFGSGVGSSGGGGGGSGSNAAASIANAWQAITDSIWGEVKRIRGLLEGSGKEAFAAAQARFVIATAQARADDQEAYKALPGLSQAMLALAENNASTLLELQRIRGQTAASLSDTASMVSGKYGLNVPSFDVGTNYVQRDMLAMIHEGEAIIPRAYNPTANGGGNSNAEMANALRRMADRLDAIEANTRFDAQHNAKTARLLERLTPDGDAIQVRETKKLGVPA